MSIVMLEVGGIGGASASRSVGVYRVGFGLSPLLEPILLLFGGIDLVQSSGLALRYVLRGRHFAKGG